MSLGKLEGLVFAEAGVWNRKRLFAGFAGRKRSGGERRRIEQVRIGQDDPCPKAAGGQNQSPLDPAAEIFHPQARVARQALSGRGPRGCALLPAAPRSSGKSFADLS